MTLEAQKEWAERLVRLTQSADGQVFLRELQDEFDKAMKELLYADADTIFSVQGRARGLHEMLKKFSDAAKTLNKLKGNT